MSEEVKPPGDSGSVASHGSSRAFGIPEMREFAKDHPDERVRLMMKRLDETRSRSARWCEAMQRMKQEIIELKEFAEAHYSDQPGHVIYHGLTVDVPDRCELIAKIPGLATYLSTYC
jgi:hypothetical protein